MKTLSLLIESQKMNDIPEEFLLIVYKIVHDCMTIMEERTNTLNIKGKKSACMAAINYIYIETVEKIESSHLGKMKNLNKFYEFTRKEFMEQYMESKK